MEKGNSGYDWRHKFKTVLAGIISSHNVIEKYPSYVNVDKKLEYIRNAYPTIIEFLDSAIRWDYELPSGWTREKLVSAYQDSKRLNWESFKEVEKFIKTYC